MRLIALANGRIYRGVLPEGAIMVSIVDEAGARTLYDGHFLIDGQPAAPGRYVYTVDMADGTVHAITIEVAADGAAAIVSDEEVAQ